MPNEYGSSTTYYTNISTTSTSTTGLWTWNDRPNPYKKKKSLGIPQDGCFCHECEAARKSRIKNKKSKNGNRLAVLI